ncbi:MAG: hypothetical protein GOV02_02120 [Candidatus Aenigmarchaeota archaeon]|nr:hypothetical protein [Candidatus Aenigmarchaeota archaeon]
MKGFIKTLEASLAVLLILATVIMLYDAPVSYPEKDFSIIGDYCLDKIYDEGNLRNYAMKDLESEIEDELDDCMPGINHKVEICSSVDCSTSGLPDSTVVLVSRLISGDNYEREPKLVNVWMWS